MDVNPSLIEEIDQIAAKQPVFIKFTIPSYSRRVHELKVQGLFWPSGLPMAINDLGKFHETMPMWIDDRMLIAEYVGYEYDSQKGFTLRFRATEQA